MYYFIVNPNSRSGKGALIWKDLEGILNERNVEYKTFFTEYRGHAVLLSESITSDAAPENPVTLIAVGGDGTIQEVLSGVHDLSCITFGYIPTGSGNDFCRGMKLPMAPTEALNLILSDCRPHPMDVPTLTCSTGSSHFAISCGIGFDAGVCHEVGITPMKKVLNRIGLGKLVYLFVALKQLFFLNPSPMTLVMDDDNVQQFSKVYFTAVMNQKYEGGGFKFCPDAQPDDQLLDVILVEGIRKIKLLFCLPTAFFGKHVGIRGIHILTCSDIHVHSASALPIHIDGESGGIREDLTVSIEKSSLKIILPVV